LLSKDGQLLGLEKRFETQKYLSTPDRIELADMLHLSQLQVKTWYVYQTCDSSVARLMYINFF